jgi:hypothetical protein
VGDGDQHEELQCLQDWLAYDNDFRGRVEVERSALCPEQMGELAEVLIVTLGSGGAVTALANSVSVWLRQRRSGFSAVITQPDGTRVEITAEGPAADRVVEALGKPIPESRGR